jgi:hypothetical protein
MAVFLYFLFVFRLGHGELVKEGSMSVPLCIQTFHLLQIKVESVACGGEHTLAITRQGVCQRERMCVCVCWCVWSGG